jgi:hypothetical protein
VGCGAWQLDAAKGMEPGVIRLLFNQTAATVASAVAYLIIVPNESSLIKRN